MQIFPPVFPPMGPGHVFPPANPQGPTPAETARLRTIDDEIARLLQERAAIEFNIRVRQNPWPQPQPVIPNPWPFPPAPVVSQPVVRPLDFDSVLKKIPGQGAASGR